MEISVSFCTAPISPPPPGVAAHIGSVIEFCGNVRGEENGSTISALRYEIYEEMAMRAIREILATLERAHPCLSVEVIHRHGVVPVGEAAIWLRIASRHRGEGIRMLEDFMIRLKQDVPIWKTEAIP